LRCVNGCMTILAARINGANISGRVDRFEPIKMSNG
jgi:hypothetical protein